MAEKTRYSDDELEEFRQIILAKLEKLNTTVDNINRITTDASDSTKDLKVLRNEIDATVTTIKNLSREIEGILSSGKQKEIKLP